MHRACCVLVLLGVWSGAAGPMAAASEAVTLPSSYISQFSVPGEASETEAGFEGIALALGAEGGMWFTQSMPGRLDRITPSGVLNAEFLIPFGFTEATNVLPRNPVSVARGEEGDMWFADDGTEYEGLYEEPYHRIGVATPAGFVNEFRIPWAGLAPTAIVLGPEGDLWFAEPGDEGHPGVVGRVTPAGAFSEFQIPGLTLQTQEGEPTALAFGAEGDLWFTDLSESEGGQNFIDRLTPLGRLERFELPLGYSHPDAIALGGDGNMWFTESPDAVGRITSAGAISEYAVPEVSGSLDGLALGPEGNIWFTEKENALGRITPGGVVTSFAPASLTGQQPSALAVGVNGDLWYTEGHEEGAESIVRLNTPVAPRLEVAPSVSGPVIPGQTLTVSQGAWADGPEGFDYQWQVCDVAGASCAELPGENRPTHTLTASEAGDTLRAVVTARNVGGVVSAVSPTTQVVASLPVASPAQQAPVGVIAVLASRLEWKFARASTYLIVKHLIVNEPPSPGWVEVQCRGRGCPFSRKRVAVPRGARSLPLQGLLRGRRLGVRAQLVVDIGAPEAIGKTFAFTVRYRRSARLQSGCLAANSSHAVDEC